MSGIFSCRDAGQHIFPWPPDVTVTALQRSVIPCSAVQSKETQQLQEAASVAAAYATPSRRHLSRFVAVPHVRAQQRLLQLMAHATAQSALEQGGAVSSSKNTLYLLPARDPGAVIHCTLRKLPSRAHNSLSGS